MEERKKKNLMDMMAQTICMYQTWALLSDYAILNIMLRCVREHVEAKPMLIGQHMEVSIAQPYQFESMCHLRLNPKKRE